jgi:hypothetical protein
MSEFIDRRRLFLSRASAFFFFYLKKSKVFVTADNQSERERKEK